MLGTLKMPDGTIATLEDDGYWTHPDKKLEFDLNIKHSLHNGGISDSLPAGAMAIYAAAKTYGGEPHPDDTRDLSSEDN